MPGAVAEAQRAAEVGEVVEAELEVQQLLQPRLPWLRQLRQQPPLEVEVEAVDGVVVERLRPQLQQLAPQVDKPRLRNCPTT
jgi:hypothetical protein